MFESMFIVSGGGVWLYIKNNYIQRQLRPRTVRLCLSLESNTLGRYSTLLVNEFKQGWVGSCFLRQKNKNQNIKTSDGCTILDPTHTSTRLHTRPGDQQKNHKHMSIDVVVFFKRSG